VKRYDEAIFFYGNSLPAQQEIILAMFMFLAVSMNAAHLLYPAACAQSLPFGIRNDVVLFSRHCKEAMTKQPRSAH